MADELDIAQALFGTVRRETGLERTATAAQAIQGTARSDSSGGRVEVYIDGTVCDVVTGVAVRAGQSVEITASGTGMYVSSVAGWGDRIQGEVAEAKEVAAEAVEEIGRTSSHFYVDEDSGTGVYVLSEPGETDAGKNIRLAADGIQVRDGGTVLGQFSGTQTVLGRTDGESPNVRIGTGGMQICRGSLETAAFVGDAIRLGTATAAISLCGAKAQVAYRDGILGIYGDEAPVYIYGQGTVPNADKTTTRLLGGLYGHFSKAAQTAASSLKAAYERDSVYREGRVDVTAGNGGSSVEVVADVFKVNGKALLDLVHPVGAVYISYVSASPASLFGGSWTAITGRFPYFNGGTATGGASTHQHTYAIAMRAYYGAPVGTDNDILHAYDGTSGWINAKVAGGQDVLVNSALAAGTKTVSGVRIETGNVRTSSASSMPPYQTLYAWRRTA